MNVGGFSFLVSHFLLHIFQAKALKVLFPAHQQLDWPRDRIFSRLQKRQTELNGEVLQVRQALKMTSLAPLAET